jgi:hypothetical protein
MITLIGGDPETQQIATAGPNGGFFFFGVPSGAYTVMVEGGSLGSMQSSFVFRQGPVAGITLTLQLTPDEMNADQSPGIGVIHSRPTNPTMMGQLATTTIQTLR